MKHYQLSKSDGKLWWTSTIDAEMTELPMECDKYVWVSSKKVALTLSGTKY